MRSVRGRCDCRGICERPHDVSACPVFFVLDVSIKCHVKAVTLRVFINAETIQKKHCEKVVFPGHFLFFAIRRK